MHLGNLFAALLAWLDVRSLGGEMVLRMEDLDPDRCKAAYLDQLADDLTWLGLDWDLGWRKGETDYCQSHRTAFYEAAFRTLADRDLVYPCYCSRKELLAASAPHASDGARVYDGHCRNLTAPQRRELEARGRRPAWRIKVPARTVMPSRTGISAPNPSGWTGTAGTSSSAAPTGSTPTSWRWPPTTGPWGSPGWSGAGTCSPPPPGRSGCWRSWGIPSLPTATFPS